MRPPRPLGRLTSEEIKLKELIQGIFSQNGVLRGTSEQEWNTYCTRKVLKEFSALIVEHMQNMEKKPNRKKK